MANIFDWNALEERINAIQRDYDDLDDRSRAFTVLAVSAIMDMSIEEGVDTLTDGGNDRGIDAVYIDNRENRNDIHIIQSKCVESFAGSQKHFPGREVDKMVSFVEDLTTENLGALQAANENLSQKIHDCIQTLHIPKSTVTVHFIGNQAPLISHELDRVQSVFGRYTAVKFRMHDLDSISDFFLYRALPSIDRDLEVIDTNYFSRTDRNLRGLVCTIAASEIVEAIRSERNTDEVNAGIFDENVRVYLNKKNRINGEIIESALAEDNNMFWYQNNGITMTCDRYTITPARRAPTISLENLQIVNGGQTSHCLFEAAKEDSSKIENVLLLVRIIETVSEEVKRSISKSTNRQTPINVRDLRANDRQQRQLQESFASRGFYYERKAGQFSEQPLGKRIDALDAAQAYLAFGLGWPEIAKKDRGRIFGDLYDTVFSDELTLDKLLISHRIMKRINSTKSNLRKRLRSDSKVEKGELALIDGAFHVIFALRQIILNGGGSFWNDSVQDSDLAKAIDIVKALFLREMAGDENFSSNRLFKDNRTRDKIIRDIQ